MTEIIFLAVLALIVIGPKQLPEMAKTIGRFLNELKRSTESLKEDMKIKVDLDLETRRSEMAAQFKKQQEQLREREKTTALPIADEDRQLTLDGLEKEFPHKPTDQKDQQIQQKTQQNKQDQRDQQIGESGEEAWKSSKGSHEQP
ncbi:MAG: twin-arginine translocase TatA/TatE family subunit [Bdellovibrionaceae bacterium]|nr:twin-arginine translocase TatA/TatE family subunit [Pseudobdellovibrionaceae bacterium]